MSSQLQIPTIEHKNKNNFQIITEQCLIRPITPEDKENYINLFGDKEVMRLYAGGAKDANVTATRVDNWVNRWQRHNFSAFAITARKTGEFLGHAVIGHGDYEGDINNGWSEYAIALKSEAQNKKVGTEVTEALVNYAKDLAKRGEPVPLDVEDKYQDEVIQLAEEGKVTIYEKDNNGKYKWVGGKFTVLRVTTHKENKRAERIFDKIFTEQNRGTRQDSPTDPNRLLYTLQLA
jgi:RimJ/RimL family protein N-acetyltransferase